MSFQRKKAIIILVPDKAERGDAASEREIICKRKAFPTPGIRFARKELIKNEIKGLNCKSVIKTSKVLSRVLNLFD